MNKKKQKNFIRLRRARFNAAGSGQQKFLRRFSKSGRLFCPTLEIVKKLSPLVLQEMSWQKSNVHDDQERLANEAMREFPWSQYVVRDIIQMISLLVLRAFWRRNENAQGRTS